MRSDSLDLGVCLEGRPRMIGRRIPRAAHVNPHVQTRGWGQGSRSELGGASGGAETLGGAELRVGGPPRGPFLCCLLQNEGTKPEACKAGAC